MDFGSLILQTETDEKIEKNNDLVNQTPSLTVNGKEIKLPSKLPSIQKLKKKGFILLLRQRRHF